MQIITNNKRLPKGVLQVIATIGWACVLYLCYVILMDSIERGWFAIGAIAGQIPSEINPFIDRYTAHPWQTLAHTATGVVFSVLGPLQFAAPVRRRFPLAHRISGRIFLPLAILNGIAAFLMTLSFPVWGAMQNFAIALTASVLMVFCFVYAFVLVRKRQFARHREWMMRGFALGLGVALFRVGLDTLLPAIGMEDFNQRWDVVMATSFPITLICAELWIRATRPAKPAARSESLAAEVQPGA
jgi:uncharacterized membrane protein